MDEHKEHEMNLTITTSIRLRCLSHRAMRKRGIKGEYPMDSVKSNQLPMEGGKYAWRLLTKLVSGITKKPNGLI